MIAIWINTVAAIMIIVGVIGIKLTDKYVDGRGIYNSSLWFIIGILGFCIAFWTTIIMIAYWIMMLDIGG